MKWIPSVAASTLVVVVAGACLEGAASPQSESRLDAAREPAVAGGDTGIAPSDRVLRIVRGDDLTTKHLAELQRRSATGRDLLYRIERLQSTVLIIRANPVLVKTTGLYGRGSFWVAAGRLFGHLQYQTESLGNDRPLCVIVHELAHAVEVAGMDRREGTAAIRTFVLSRAIDDDPLNWRGSETEFPRTIMHHVWLELLGYHRGPSVLDSLALVHGVTLPPAQSAETPPEALHPEWPHSRDCSIKPRS
jgi:hypothetical protein